MPSPGVVRMVRPWLLLGALVLTSVVLGERLVRSGAAAPLPLNDFVQYWAAGRLQGAGENPYDPARMQQLEQSAGRDADVLLMWNPPWVLPLLQPFGRLEPPVAYLAWMALLLGSIAVSAVLTWDHYGGARADVGLALLLAFTFVPTFVALLLAQIAPLLLLGAALFLWAERRGRPGLAGAAAVLLAIKPHLTYLFWLALLLWSLRQRRFAMLAGAVLAGAICMGLALAGNPAVLGQYFHFFTEHPPAQYRSPTLGTLLRLAIDPDNFRLQYLALVPGLLWLAWYWRRHGSDWDWSRALPALLLASLLTAAYGAWPFDLVVLLVPLLRIAARRPPGSVVATYAASNGIALALVLSLTNFIWFAWLAPALALVYAAAVQEPRPAAASRPACN